MTDMLGRLRMRAISWFICEDTPSSPAERPDWTPARIAPRDGMARHVLIWSKALVVRKAAGELATGSFPVNERPAADMTISCSDIPKLNDLSGKISRKERMPAEEAESA
jgi:hypothetical protein